MKKLLLFALLFSIQIGFSQNYIDTIFQINTISNIEYGTAIDFKGEEKELLFDISYPIDDSPPTCGRPLLIMIHGGAWYAGNKGEGYAPRIREDFAKRGYVTASVNYRLGLFNTEKNVDCILDGWKCWNMADTTEWYRANYRAVQDVHGAIRYIVNNKEDYAINPDNVFIVGESAGGFVAMGVGFMEDDSEVDVNLISEQPDVLAPNMIYEASCIQEAGIADNIEEMELARPTLGNFQGTMNLPAKHPIRIRGVGNLFGGAFTNIFETKGENNPALYLFHQPCDLIVPFQYNRLLTGYNNCANDFPAFCQNIINRPFVYGSKGIANLIDTMLANNIPTCEYQFDNSGNNYSCAQQVIDPTLGCHALDNYWNRTTNLASYFAEYVAICMTDIQEDISATYNFNVYPNPTGNTCTIEFKKTISNAKVSLISVYGQTLLTKGINGKTLSMDLTNFPEGVYLIKVEIDDEVSFKKISKN